MSKKMPKLDFMLAEHRHLKELFSRVEAFLSAESVSHAQFKDLLDDLSRDVLQHFAHEEESRLFEQIAVKEPRLEPEAKLLKQQHQMMRDLLSQIAGLVHQDNMSASELRDACKDLREFKLHFDAHEEDENRLLQEAYDRDVGSKD